MRGTDGGGAEEVTFVTERQKDQPWWPCLEARCTPCSMKPLATRCPDCHIYHSGASFVGGMTQELLSLSRGWMIWTNCCRCPDCTWNHSMQETDRPGVLLGHEFLFPRRWTCSSIEDQRWRTRSGKCHHPGTLLRPLQQRAGGRGTESALRLDVSILCLETWFNFDLSQGWQRLNSVLKSSMWGKEWRGVAAHHMTLLKERYWMSVREEADGN